MRQLLTAARCQDVQDSSALRLAGPDACPDGRCPGALWGLWPEASLQASVVWISAESPGPESPALAGWSGSPGDGAPLRWTPCVLPCPPQHLCTCCRLPLSVPGGGACPALTSPGKQPFPSPSSQSGSPLKRLQLPLHSLPGSPAVVCVCVCVSVCDFAAFSHADENLLCAKHVLETDRGFRNEQDQA